jgi:3-hydroxyacyl-CoA dehydrogenase / enoyl-CoA hydratase / 3-hydroxybutyryl-CoA epimerase
MTNHATRHWRLETDSDRIAWLTIDRADSSANSLNREVIEELETLLAELTTRAPRGLVVRSAKAGGFIAGADVAEFRSLATPEQALPLIRRGQTAMDRLANLPFVTVAAIDGFALGGGLELALACRYRIATSRSTLGFPEVMLGIHPGFGGTVRGPNLVGARAALDLILTGRSVRADAALRMGLVDRVVDSGALISEAARCVREPTAHRQPPFVDRLISLPGMRTLIARQLRRTIRKRARQEHYPAPYAAVDLWQRFGARGPAAYAAEAESIARLFCTETSRGLVRVFFLQERLKELGRSGREFKRVHVVGAGVMGGDIAAWCAYRGLDVTLQDRTLEQIQPALTRAAEFFTKRCRRSDESERCVARLRADPVGAGAATADVVIEAIFENADAKRELYAQLEPRLRDDALLCSNTSSILLEDLACDLSRPERMVGLHFFNPVGRMPLVEIVRGSQTAAGVARDAMTFARALDKLPLPCRSAPGFVVNRVLMAYMSEALRAAQEGIPLAVIDCVATDFGMPQGPIELADTVGLDVALHVGRILAKAFGHPSPESLAPLVAAGTLGRKTAQGFYAWRDGKPVKSMVAGAAPPADLEDRLILQYVNESVACLREGIADDEELLDAGAIFGTGFAPFRGGPLHYARQRGIDACVARLERLATLHGEHFRPDAGWQRLRELDSPHPA